MTPTEHTHKVRERDLLHAERVLNSPRLSKSAGEIYAALRALVGHAERIEGGE